MEKSIENIWKEGFTKNENLNAPELVSFYTKKSKHLITRIKNTVYSNHKGSILGAFTLLIFYIILGQILTGCIIFTICITAYIVGKKQLKSMEQINFGTNSYEYLKNFDTWWKDNISKGSRVIKHFLPLIMFLVFSLQIFDIALSQPIRFQQIINDPIAIYIGLGFIAFIILLWILSAHLYKKVLDLIYGKELSKLKDLIDDMEELRSIK